MEPTDPAEEAPRGGGDPGERPSWVPPSWESTPRSFEGASPTEPVAPVPPAPPPAAGPAAAPRT
ncbi:MAG: hypothetical protein ACRDJO_07340, partial [Actinomycetota bacterium]